MGEAGADAAVTEMHFELFPTRSLSLCLVEGVTNAAELREEVMKQKFEASFIDASMVALLPPPSARAARRPHTAMPSARPATLFAPACRSACRRQALVCPHERDERKQSRRRAQYLRPARLRARACMRVYRVLCAGGRCLPLAGGCKQGPVCPLKRCPHHTWCPPSRFLAVFSLSVSLSISHSREAFAIPSSILLGTEVTAALEQL
jgi:hypothetical protein